jgi:hypothetical protein
MTALEQRLMQSLKQLSPDRMAEVVDFAEFLAARERRASAAARLGEVFAKIDALGLPPVSDEEIEQAIQETRQANRQGA